MADENKKNPFKKEKLYLVGAATVLGILIIAGESSLIFSQDSIFGRLTDKTNVEDTDSDGEDADESAAKALTAEAGLTDMIFTDIPADHPNADALLFMKENGIMKGYSDGSFLPDKEINRAELIKTIIVALGEPKNINEHKKCFTDVNEEWFAPYGCYAKWKGWVKGYGDGGFHPSNDVTRAEALKMMVSAYGIPLETAAMNGSDFAEITAEEWYAPYVWTAEKNGYTWEWKEHNALNIHNKATRLEVATAIYELETGASRQPTI